VTGDLSSLSEIETPTGLVDLVQARANAEAVVGYLSEHGLRWRPHIKTHKSLTLARIQLQAGATGLTVATPREAEVMSTVCDDILIAYPVLGASKLRRITGLREEMDLKVGLDSLEALEALAAAARAAGRSIGVLVEVDVGMRRVGRPSPEGTVELAERVRDTEGVSYRGLMFYPGQIRVPGPEQDAGIGEVAERLQAFYEACSVRDLSPEIVSGGSTPTLWRSHEMPGVTEVRAGTAIFYDREGLELGVVDRDALAYTVLATVVSNAVPGQAVVDAGSKALSKEGRGGDGFAVLHDHPEVTVRGLSEEHGVLDLSRSEWVPRIGDRVRIVPNHVCVSVNLQDRLWGWDGSEWAAVPLEGRGRGVFEGSA